MSLIKGAHCPCSMKPAGEKGPPEPYGGQRGSKPDSTFCLHSHEPERSRDIKKAVPDNASTPAKDGAPAREVTVAPEAKIPNNSVLRKFAMDKETAADDEASRGHKDAGPEKTDTNRNEASGKLPTNTAAADHNQMKLVIEDDPGNVIPNVPRLRSTQLK